MGYWHYSKKRLNVFDKPAETKRSVVPEPFPTSLTTERSLRACVVRSGADKLGGWNWRLCAGQGRFLRLFLNSRFSPTASAASVRLGSFAGGAIPRPLLCGRLDVEWRGRGARLESVEQGRLKSLLVRGSRSASASTTPVVSERRVCCWELCYSGCMYS